MIVDTEMDRAEEYRRLRNDGWEFKSDGFGYEVQYPPSLQKNLSEDFPIFVEGGRLETAIAAAKAAEWTYRLAMKMGAFKK